MRIKAKFFSACPRCGEKIRPGDDVEWASGEKAVHRRCLTVDRCTSGVGEGEPPRRCARPLGHDGDHSITPDRGFAVVSATKLLAL